MNIVLDGYERFPVSFTHLPRSGDQVEYRVDNKGRTKLITGVVNYVVFQNSIIVDEQGRETEYSEVQVHLKDVVRTPL